MAFIPSFDLYASNGITLIYTFPVVQYTNLPVSNGRYIEIEGQRGIGSIILDGGQSPFDIIINGFFMIQSASEGYTDIVEDIANIESTIVLNTPYYLRVDKTISTYWEYKVKRILPIEYPESLRTDYQEYKVTLRALCW